MKHARWVDCSNGWMCSACKNDCSKDYEYCPHCGAKMDLRGIDEITEAVDNLIKHIEAAKEVCEIRELGGQWGCAIGNCDKCTSLAINLVYQRLKERGKENEDSC
mgnify:CR=1 FL=1